MILILVACMISTHIGVFEIVQVHRWCTAVLSITQLLTHRSCCRHLASMWCYFTDQITFFHNHHYYQGCGPISQKTLGVTYSMMLSAEDNVLVCSTIEMESYFSHLSLNHYHIQKITQRMVTSDGVKASSKRPFDSIDYLCLVSSGTTYYLVCGAT